MNFHNKVMLNDSLIHKAYILVHTLLVLFVSFEQILFSLSVYLVVWPLHGVMFFPIYISVPNHNMCFHKSNMILYTLQFVQCSHSFNYIDYYLCMITPELYKQWLYRTLSLIMLAVDLPPSIMCLLTAVF
jgi:hypothetical protein